MAISDPSGGLLLQIETVWDSKPSPAQRLNLSTTQLSGIGDILGLFLEQAAPLLKQGRGASGEQAAGELYRMVVPPHLQEAIKSGAASVMSNEKGVMSGVRDGKNVIGSVTFKEVQGVASTTSSLAGILPAAGVIAATALILVKLEKIDRKLSTIGHQVGEVSQFQRDTANGELLAGVSQLQRYQVMLRDHPSREDARQVRHGLDTIFREAEARFNACLLNLRTLIAKPPTFDSPALRTLLGEAAPDVQSLTLSAVVMARTAALATLLPDGTVFASSLGTSRDRAFTATLEAFQTIHNLPVPPERRLPLARPHKLPRLLRGLHGTASRVSYLIETTRQEQQAKRQTHNEQAAAALLHPADALLSEAQALADSPADLTTQSAALVLLARMDRQGQVTEVYVETPELVAR